MAKKYIPKDWHLSPDHKIRLGVKGEDIACDYLAKQGIRIIDCNVRFPIGEIDIIAIDNDRLCFVEVKTRQNLKYGRPALAVNAKKQITIRKLAEWYIKTHGKYASLRPRIDVIELYIAGDGKEYINYIKAAF